MFALCWPRSVWIDEEGVRLICLLLRPNMTVLEYGAGGSTTMFRSQPHSGIFVIFETKKLFL